MEFCFAHLLVAWHMSGMLLAVTQQTLQSLRGVGVSQTLSQTWWREVSMQHNSVTPSFHERQGERQIHWKHAIVAERGSVGECNCCTKLLSMLDITTVSDILFYCFKHKVYNTFWTEAFFLASLFSNALSNGQKRSVLSESANTADDSSYYSEEL